MQELGFLVLTILVELPIALLVLRRENWVKVSLLVIGANMVSHPIIWYLLYYQDLNWFIAEAGVAIFEGLILALALPRVRTRAFGAGVFMNIVTALIGYLFF